MPNFLPIPAARAAPALNSRDPPRSCGGRQQRCRSSWEPIGCLPQSVASDKLGAHADHGTRYIHELVTTHGSAVPSILRGPSLPENHRDQSNKAKNRDQ